MTMLDSPPRAPSGLDERRRRASRRRRGMIATILAGALAWSLISFLADVGESQTNVSIVPGVGEDGSVASVRSIVSTVTAPKGNAQLQQGVAFARVDVATTFHRKIAVVMSWLNPKSFSTQTQTADWQVRLGLYYPVRTGACEFTGASADPDHAVTLAVDLAGTLTDHCLYRDTAATGPGASTAVTQAYNHLGTQLIATERITAILRPQVDQSAAVACSSTTDLDGCRPGATATNEVQQISAGSRTGGTFTLTFDGQTTAPIVWDATAADIKAALESLSNIDDVTVTGGPLGDTSGAAAALVTFEGDNSATNVPTMTLNATGLSGGTTDPAVSTTTEGVEGTDADARVYFVVGSLLNPAGPAPPGQQSSIEALRLQVRVDQS